MAEKQMELEITPKEVEDVTETAVIVPKSDMSVNPYTDKEAFNNLYVMAKQLSGSDIVPQNYQNKPTNCMIALEGCESYGNFPDFCYATDKCCSWKTLLERSSVFDACKRIPEV